MNRQGAPRLCAAAQRVSLGYRSIQDLLGSSCTIFDWAESLDWADLQRGGPLACRAFRGAPRCGRTSVTSAVSLVAFTDQEKLRQRTVAWPGWEGMPSSVRKAGSRSVEMVARPVGCPQSPGTFLITQPACQPKVRS